MSKDIEIRTAMVKKVAASWLEANAKPEYTLTVYAGYDSIRNLPTLLRSFRDQKVKLGSTNPVSDLGIKVHPDRVLLRSSSQDGLRDLDKWLTEHGCETTGAW